VSGPVPLSKMRPVMQQDPRGMSAGDIWRLPDGRLVDVVKINGDGTAAVEPLGVEMRGVDKAARDYAAFAGKPADRIQRFPAKTLSGTAWKLGTMRGVLYEADLEGEGKTLFFHPFKKSARPTLAVLHNGRTLATLGGAFRVTERGIVDE
jgi:hypothetical protein